MSRIRRRIKGILFLSSYTPLFVIFLIKNVYDRRDTLTLSLTDPIKTVMSVFIPLDFNSVISLVLIAIILGSNALLLYMIKKKREGDNPEGIRLVESKEANYAYIEYLITYIIPFLPLSDSSAMSLVYGFIFLMIVGLIYTRSNLLYVNIMLIVAGYNLFNVKDGKNNEYVIISKKEKLPTDEIIKFNVIDDKFIIDISSS